ncbi:MAG: thiol reductase thioredoxin [Planctomycetota bacterium]|nr:MAG: thiol reductase thioredoxin [Planctomycetota bacterium]
MLTDDYQNPGPSREEVDAMSGPVVLEFGTSWCGYCQAAAPAVSQALADFPSVRRVKVEDGPGRRLGRSFRVKLWPTLVFLRDGEEVARAVRPDDAEQVRRGLRQIAPTGSEAT